MSKLKLNNVEVISDENAAGLPQLTDNVVFPSGHIVKSTIVNNSTKVDFSDSANYQYWTFTINKSLNNNDSYLIVHGQLPGQGYYSDYCGAYCEIVGANESVRTTDGSAYKGLGYMGAEGNTEGFWLIVLKKFTGLNAGTHTVNFGWQTRNGGSSDRPFQVWNPNSVHDARNHQSRSNLIINEIKT